MADGELRERALGLEATLAGFPQRTLAELETLAPTADGAPAAERRIVYTLLGQARVQVGNTADAAELADRLEAQAARTNDPLERASALLVRATIESSAGDAARSITLAREARELAKGSGDEFLQFWAALALGTSARMRGQPEEALASLQDALSLAEKADNAYRRSTAYYQLSVLHRVLKNAPESLAASLAAYKDAEAGQERLRDDERPIAESAVMELLESPVRELGGDGAGAGRSPAARAREMAGRARLINLADIRLRRKQYGEALDHSRRSLVLAQALGDAYLTATSKANMGFALFGLGRIRKASGSTDEARADYERTGRPPRSPNSSASTGAASNELGDYKGALGALPSRAQLYEEIALQTRQRALLDVQEKYESEKRRREIDLLNRENALKTAEIANATAAAGLVAAGRVLRVVVLRGVRALPQAAHRPTSCWRRQNTELSVQSSRDPLTALYNRRYFQNLRSPRKRRSRTADKPRRTTPYRRCCSSTSITSRRRTTASAMRWAMPCWSPSRSACGIRCGRRT